MTIIVITQFSNTVGKNQIKMCFLPTTELQMSWPIPYYTHMLGFESIMFCIADSSIYFTLGGGSAWYTNSTVKAMLTGNKTSLI